MAPKVEATPVAYRVFAARAANPVIGEARLLTAEHLEAEACCFDPNDTVGNQGWAEGDNR